MSSWHRYFMQMARLVASKSKDQSTKVGCVIVGPDNEVVSTGFNGFPRGVDEAPADRWQRPIKYMRVEHAERNAIYNAARIGVSTKGCTAYMDALPCADCARALIQAGIAHIVYNRDNPFRDATRAHWEDSIEVGMSMLAEAGVTITEVVVNE